MLELDSTKTTTDIRKNILKLAWPALLMMFLQSVIGMIDVMMIGSIGPTALAAVDMSNRLIMVVVGAISALSIGATALVARYVGAKNHKQANKVMVNALISGIVLSLILALIGFLTSQSLLEMMMVLMEEVDGAVLDQGSIYLRIIFSSMVFALPMMLITAILQGIGDMKTPLYIMIISNICNVVINYLLIFGVGVFPALGVAGAAIGTILSRVVGTIAGFIVLIRGNSILKLELNKSSLKVDFKMIKEIFTIGIPAAIEQLVRQSSQIIYTILIAALGTLTLAANAIVMNIELVPIMIGFGFATAATTLVGQSLGAGKKDLAKEYAKQTAYLSTGLLIVISIPMFIFAHPIIKLFTTDLEVINLVLPILRFMIVIQALFGLIIVLAGALRGGGDTKWPMYSTIVGDWGVRLTLGLLFGYSLGYGLLGFWMAMGVNLFVMAGLNLWRYKSEKWLNIKVTEEEKLAA
ncbi:MATE family efflux transporter [Natroniella sulfidigena]|uniref:MATE family efflux transporter n=1 Tax=Natroniella sulfidigena TaxID=723921 RepID=UPI00200A5AD0|nr:MATE family efflux transporter [Natroniella sulfidigena]MCK8817570.1 MATE family efflux transporter [Natroniella sulfidigena]